MDTPAEASQSQDCSIGKGLANLAAALLAPFELALFLVPFFLLWPHRTLTPLDGIAFLALMVLGIPLHEALHAWAFVRCGRVERAAVRFGFSWKALMPYVTCSAPMRVSAYRWAIVLPGLATGALPALIGLLLGQTGLAVAGALLFACAGGDHLVLWLLRKARPEALVLDHGDRVGCLVYE